MKESKRKCKERNRENFFFMCDSISEMSLGSSSHIYSQLRNLIPG